jgi:hypothetical protein
MHKVEGVFNSTIGVEILQGNHHTICSFCELATGYEAGHDATSSCLSHVSCKGCLSLVL